MEDTTSEERDMIRRHFLNMLCNRQYFFAMSELHWTPNADFIALLEKQAALYLPTQLCEDEIGAAKNYKMAKGKRFERPEMAMSRILQAKCIDKRHHQMD